MAPVNYDMTASWIGAASQCTYFSDPKNGYINGDVISITDPNNINYVIENCNVQKGDLLYWEETKNGKKVVTHATIINNVTKNDIFLFKMLVK